MDADLCYLFVKESSHFFKESQYFLVCNLCTFSDKLYNNFAHSVFCHLVYICKHSDICKHGSQLLICDFNSGESEDNEGKIELVDFEHCLYIRLAKFLWRFFFALRSILCFFLDIHTETFKDKEVYWNFKDLNN